MGEVYRRIALAVVAWAVFGLELAHACSCGGHDDRFLVETGALLPANALGVPWWGTVDPRRGDTEGMPAKSRFSVERVDGEAAPPIDFDIVRLPTERVHGIPDRFDETVWMIAPHRGLTPRAVYRFRSKTLPWFVPSEMVSGPSDDYRRELVVEVSVAEQALDLDASPPSVHAEPQQIRDIAVTTLAGSCSTRVHAAAADIELQLEPRIGRFMGALLFSTVLDGTPWRPTKHLCGRLAPGESWSGRARERVFAPCPSKRENQAAEPAFGTTPGKHQIEMIAWLPGTSIEFPAKATIELTCPSDLVEPAEEERRAPRKRRY